MRVLTAKQSAARRRELHRRGYCTAVVQLPSGDRAVVKARGARCKAPPFSKRVQKLSLTERMKRAIGRRS